MFAARLGDAAVTRLALAAKAGDRAAATRFVEATHAEVRRFLAFLVDANEADDLTQETYLRAMRSVRRFTASSSARTWLLSIARRVAADHLRTVRRRPRAAAVAEWQVAADAAIPLHRRPRLDEQVALGDLLDRLAPQRREAFIATQVLGLSYAEAADVCGVPIGTVRSRVARAREDLVAAVRGAGDLPGRATG